MLRKRMEGILEWLLAMEMGNERSMLNVARKAGIQKVEVGKIGILEWNVGERNDLVQSMKGHGVDKTWDFGLFGM
jgi:hypothetical protein